MITLPFRPPQARAKRLAAVCYAYAFLTDLVLLYPVYALLFADTGLSAAEISSLFVIWSATSILLEVPSGALADAVSRRLLLIIAPLLSAAGYALWTAVPSYWAFAAGFVLWGAAGALASGATEAWLYEELDHLGAAGRYAGIMGRAQSAGLAAQLIATALAVPVLSAGGYPALGAASVLAHLATAAVALAFPEHRRTAPGPADPEDTADPAEEQGFRAMLRAGLAEARRDRRVRYALLLIPAVTAVWGSLEEYTPLLARESGAPQTTVPLLVLLLSAGGAAGGLLAGRAAGLGSRGLAAILAAAAITMIAGALSGHPAGFVALGVSFCGFQLATILTDARLQERITGPGRATVTSLAGLGTDVATIAVYGTYGVLAGVTGHGAAFALLTLPYLVIAAILVRAVRS